MRDEHDDDANSCIDGCRSKWVDDTKTLDEDRAIKRYEVLSSDLQEDIDSDDDERSLQVGIANVRLR